MGQRFDGDLAAQLRRTQESDSAITRFAFRAPQHAVGRRWTIGVESDVSSFVLGASW
jgi:hypothetical protein